MAKLNKEWFLAAAIRAVKTFAQTLLGLIIVGQAFTQIAWTEILSVAAVAAILSLLTSIVGLPEVGSDGTMKIDTSDPTKDTYSLVLDAPLDTLAEKSSVIFKVTK